MKKFRFKAGVLTHHNQGQMRDAVMVSDAAAAGPLNVATFPGASAICKCKAEGSDAATCDTLYIADSEGEQLAELFGTLLRARQLRDNAIVVYRMNTTTNDAAIDAAVIQIQNRLAEVNRRNAEFWANSVETAE